jgi:hypothetical protein
MVVSLGLLSRPILQIADSVPLSAPSPYKGNRSPWKGKAKAVVSDEEGGSEGSASRHQEITQLPSSCTIIPPSTIVTCKCPHCPRSYASLIQLERHHRFNHSRKNGDKVFATFGKKSPLIQLGLYLLINGEGKYVCMTIGCGKAHTSKELLKSHFTMHQLEYGDRVEGYDAWYMLVEGEGRFVCLINNVADGKPCRKPLNSVQSLCNHVRRNHGRTEQER